MASTTTSSWCFHCNTLVNVSDETTLVCPLCTTRSLVARIQRVAPNSAPVSPLEPRRRHIRSTGNGAVPTSLYNPVILLRTPPTTPGGNVNLVGTDANGERLFRLYYEGGARRSGLRPLPPSMTEFLLGPGFDRLLDQLSQLEINRPVNSRVPACEAAIESMPVVQIEPSHICAELNCSVCHEEFEIGSEAREMPCKHLYHSECIIPWLAISNSCPICRHELARETQNESTPNQNQGNNNNNNNNNSRDVTRNGNTEFGITIWRLPNGGYAVGQFSGSNYVLPRNIALGSRRSGGMRRLFGGFVSLCKRFMSSSSLSSSSSSSLASPSSTQPGSPENLIRRNRSASIS